MMKVRADKFVCGHYAYFVELPERNAKYRVALSEYAKR
jgi:hypothetical protein